MSMTSESDERIVLNNCLDSPSTDDANSGGSNVGNNGPLKKGPWTSAEDAILIEYVTKHGEGNWNAVQKHSGLARCGKSCRLRWANHLRPDLKKGAFTPEEEHRIIELHAKMGNKWAKMAAELPGRTDNEIKNFWNTRIKRRQRAGLPIYPPDICFPASNNNPQTDDMNTLSPDNVPHPDFMPVDNFIKIPSVEFKGLELDHQFYPQALIDPAGTNFLDLPSSGLFSRNFNNSSYHNRTFLPTSPQSKRLRGSDSLFQNPVGNAFAVNGSQLYQNDCSVQISKSYAFSHLVASSSSAQGKKKKVSMSVVSGEGMPLVPSSSSSAQRKEKKHVVIYYTTYGITYRLKGRFVCFPVDSLIAPKSPSKEKTRKKFKLKLPFSDGTYFKHGMSCICTTTSSVGAEETSPGPGLYLFGGMDPPVVRDLRLRYQYLLKKAYRYGLHNLPEEIGSAERCTDMIYGMSELLLAQVGDDCIYALGRGKTRDDESLEPAFLEYNFKENKWASLVDRHFVDIINNCDCDEWVRENLDFVPHIVIGRKLHVSLGNSSFTFDTENRVWEDCMLFKTFWSEQQKKRGRHCPSNFYGTEVWVGDTDLALKKRKRNKFGGGPPFGFSGRGILWDKDILLGIHYADNCALVAFQLDDEGRVVRSQRVTMDNLSMNIEFLRNGAKLVDLGRDDYFGLVHFLGDEDIGNHFYNEDLVHMQLVIFKVSRLAPQEIAAAAPDDDHDFLDCQFVRSKTLVKNCPQGIGSLYNVFCV